jgi:hypothetical protein
MARKPRIQYPGAFYHVIARGNGGTYLKAVTRRSYVTSKGLKKLEKRVREDEAIAATITMLKEFLTQKKRPNTHLVEPDPISFLSR